MTEIERQTQKDRKHDMKKWRRKRSEEEEEEEEEEIKIKNI